MPTGTEAYTAQLQGFNSKVRELGLHVPSSAASPFFMHFQKSIDENINALHTYIKNVEAEAAGMASQIPFTQETATVAATSQNPFLQQAATSVADQGPFFQGTATGMADHAPFFQRIFTTAASQLPFAQETATGAANQISFTQEEIATAEGQMLDLEFPFMSGDLNPSAGPAEGYVPTDGDFDHLFDELTRDGLGGLDGGVFANDSFSFDDHPNQGSF
ncbi:hypothetical protein B0T25DRAFT_555343 [Lasiosphaeria hispida]|uniref:Uncharacterized protein n=1 Tax=Lasiosphaeria hispida TaxID=260671 RepID=A0AAJ0H8T9_9PEZI|nr:hypothetical protein B0T25DRAFT_555343 [Lasiosphaeria hispida]